MVSIVASTVHTDDYKRVSTARYQSQQRKEICASLFQNLQGIQYGKYFGSWGFKTGRIVKVHNLQTSKINGAAKM